MPHLSGQPSAVKKEQTSRTRDVLAFSSLICTNMTQALSLLSYGIQKIPPILIADADSSTTTAAAAKKTIIQ